LNFFTKGCKSYPEVVETIQTVFTLLVQAIRGTHDVAANFTEYISNSTAFALVQNTCSEDVDLVAASVNMTDSLLHGILSSLDDTRRLMFCSKWNPLYVKLAYDALCINGVSGLSQIYISQLCIAIFSMTMVTLRVSWQQVEQNEINSAIVY